MKIKIALIPSDYIAEVQELSAKLQRAVEAGEMRVVDQETEKLLSFTNKDCSLSVSEESWYQMIAQLRNINKNFKSDYVIKKPQLEVIIAARLAESFVDIVNIAGQALKTESILLQIPYEEENEDV